MHIDSKIKCSGVLGLFGIFGTSGGLVVTHKYLVPLDSSDEVMAMTIALSCFLYIASFVALGYAYQLRKKDTEGAGIRSECPSLPSTLSVLADTLPLIPKNISTQIIGGYVGDHKALNEALKTLVSHLKPCLVNSKTLWNKMYYHQLDYVLKTLENFPQKANFTRKEKQVGNQTFKTQSAQVDEWGWVERLLFGKHPWNVRGQEEAPTPRTLLESLEYAASSLDLDLHYIQWQMENWTLPRIQGYLRNFTEATGLGADEPSSAFIVENRQN